MGYTKRLERDPLGAHGNKISQLEISWYVSPRWDLSPIIIHVHAGRIVQWNLLLKHQTVTGALQPRLWLSPHVSGTCGWEARASGDAQNQGSLMRLQRLLTFVLWGTKTLQHILLFHSVTSDSCWFASSVWKARCWFGFFGSLFCTNPFVSRNAALRRAERCEQKTWIINLAREGGKKSFKAVRTRSEKLG